MGSTLRIMMLRMLVQVMVDVEPSQLYESAPGECDTQSMCMHSVGLVFLSALQLILGPAS